MAPLIKNEKPLIRWAGGKTWLLPRLLDFIPNDFKDYHEPFFGGGSVFFNLFHDRKSFLSDINGDLINFLVQLKLRSREIIDALSNYKNSKSFYYHVRSSKVSTRVERAARFYYLNRTCFNGIYRVNKLGEFNVPYGYRKRFEFVDEQALEAFSRKLKKASIKRLDFQDTLKNINPKDLVFVDPPYTVAHSNNGFIEYNQHIFKWEDQERLALFLKQVDRKGAYYIMTNAVHSSINKLYNSIGNKFEVERFSTISADHLSRRKISELIITNCL
jgi:DNA adenine methylase